MCSLTQITWGTVARIETIYLFKDKFMYLFQIYKYRSNLSERFAQTDSALDNISNWPMVHEHSLNRIFESKERFKIKLEDFR